jgi:hypothetical protein
MCGQACPCSTGEKSKKPVFSNSVTILLVLVDRRVVMWPHWVTAPATTQTARNALSYIRPLVAQLLLRIS